MKAIVCDICKETVPLAGKESKLLPWVNDQTYLVVMEKGESPKLGDQKFELRMSLKLACGQEFDLCRKCGWKIVHKFLKDKPR